MAILLSGVSVSAMHVHLVDGISELARQHFGQNGFTNHSLYGVPQFLVHLH
jgi:hypothetical protein